MAEFGCEDAVRAILETDGGKKCAKISSDHGKPINLAAMGGKLVVVVVVVVVVVIAVVIVVVGD